MSDLRTRWLADEIGMIDLNFQDHPALIASYVLRTSDGVVLIETGPGSTINALHRGLTTLDIDFNDIRHILVTHIHLDHAGACGSLLAALPRADFHVHERGLRHMLAPERLVASARQIYGALMDPLWGDFLPTPENRTVPITDGDTLNFGDTTIDVHCTPGHASHHVSFHDLGRNAVFAGDVAGVRIPPSPLVWPPSPPPDIDVEAWKASTRTLRDLDPERILISHFGEYWDVWPHLDRCDDRLDQWVGLVSAWRDRGLSRDEMIEELERGVMTEIASDRESASTAYASRFVTPFYMNVDGLMRYLDKREQTTG